MSTYINPNITKRVMVSEDEWIDMRAELSVKELFPFAKFSDGSEFDYEEVIEAVGSLVVNWNVKDSDNNFIEFSKDKVCNLSIDTFLLLQKYLEEIINPLTLEKKSFVQ